MYKKLLLIFLLVLLLSIVFIYRFQIITIVDDFNTRNQASVAMAVRSPFTYHFAVDGNLHEVGDMELSSSPYFWLNSGGQFILKDGIGMTMQGEAPIRNKWRYLYKKSSAMDTDNGLHPQNLLRLITRSKWDSFSEQVYFKINKFNLSDSTNRNDSNGVLLMSRYKDSDNLYYAGWRVDDNLVIKSKKNGTYETLATKHYGKLPEDTWIGIKVETSTLTDGSVLIKLYVDRGNNKDWQLVLEAVDRKNAIIGEGYAGIRTDFMDVEFDNYSFQNI